MSRILKQSFFLPSPVLTEKNLPSQAGRVFIITGGYAGCGFELAKTLYQSNGTVYVAGRSRTKADSAMQRLRSENPRSKGRIAFLEVDLADLSTIKPAVDTFLAKEQRLDVLTNNAGVMMPPPGSLSAQKHELQIATNCLGPYLFAKLLTPLLIHTASLPETVPGSVRVTWAASTAIDGFSPPGGMTFDSDDGYLPHPKNNQNSNYGASKAGNYFLASQFALRHPESGVISNAWNPGNLNTELQRHASFLMRLIGKLLMHDSKYGGYTELWAGWSEQAGHKERNGAYVWPWGRFGGVREDVQAEIDKGVDGKAGAFWEWCEKETKKYA